MSLPEEGLPHFDPLEFLRSLQKEPYDYERMGKFFGEAIDTQWTLARELSSGKEVALGVFTDFAAYRIRFLFVRRLIIPLVVNLPRVVTSLGFFRNENTNSGDY
jgi:hypothetical protein